MDARKTPLQTPASRRQTVLWACLLIVVLSSMSPSIGNAQVTTNITTSGLNTQVNQAGNSYTITGGTRPGGGPNLFHSFGNFNVGGGDIANFLNTTPALTTSNILGRVTGGNISNIDGTIQTTGFGSANLFLMNPSGIVLGPGATLNVGGSVSFTTAQYIRLLDGVGANANFYANPANDGLANSILTINSSAFEFLSASPAGYGFLTAPDPNATITVQGSNLSVPSGQSISLVGGNIMIEGGAKLSAPSGSIQLASALSPGEFDVATLGSLPNVDGASFASVGSVSLASGSSIDVHGANTVLIKGGQLVLSVNEATLSTSENPVPPDTIALRSGSSIITSNSGTDPGADLQLTANSLTLENSSAIATRNSDLGLVGGNLVLNVGTLRLLGGDSGGSQIASINNTGIDLDGDGLVDVTGVGGNITVQGTQGGNSAADSVALSGGSRITSDASSTGGNGGGISIRATSLDLGETSTISSSTGGTGQGGNIALSVQRLRLIDDATIVSSTSSENLIPAAGGTVTVQGVEGPGSMASSVQLSGPNAVIASDSAAGGVPGDITVNARTLTITNGAAIASGSSSSIGAAGKVTVTADSVVISAGGQIFSRSFFQNSSQVTITADALTMDKGSIDTGTSSESGGRGGDVVINGGTVSLTNGSRISSQSGSEDAPFSTGRAGDITMNVGSLRLANRSEITSSSKGTVEGAGDAGNITIQSRSTVTLDNSSITTEAIEASGGRITINAPEMIRLVNSPVSTSVKDGAGGGGNISIDPDFVILQNSQILARAFAGDGGAIGISAGLFLADPSSAVDATSTLGVSGTVQINAAINNLSEVIARLPESLLAVQALLRASCAAKLAQGATSSFVERGRDGIPTGPDGLLASPYLPITSERSTQLRAQPSIRKPGIQLRRLFGQKLPSSVTLISDHAVCSS